MRTNGKPLLVSHRLLVCILVAYLALVLAWVALFKLQFNLWSERDTRASQIDQTLLITCRRENALGQPSRRLFAFVLTLPSNNSKEAQEFRRVLREAVQGLSPINCRQLPALK